MSKKLKIIISIILSLLIIFIGIFLIVSNNSPVGEKYSKEFIKSINYIKEENYIEAYNNIKNSDKDEKNLWFENIIEFVKNDFKQKLTEEEIIKTMSANVKLGTNLFIKVIPLELKKAIVRLSYLEIRKYTTITFSNIGRIGIIGKYKDYIDEFLMLIAPEPVEKIKCSGCTFENKMSFTFTSILNDNNIEKTFYNFLKSRGIKVRIESNGVLDDISKEN